MASAESYRLEFHCASPQAHALLVSEHSANLLALSEQHSVRIFSCDETKRGIVNDKDQDDGVVKGGGACQDLNNSGPSKTANCGDARKVNLRKTLSVAAVFEHLRTKWAANVLIYAPCGVGSTQDVLKSRVMPWTGKNGWVVITGQQNGGRGRRGNLWSSPLGSISMTLALTLPTKHMNRLVFLQYVAALAIAQTARQTNKAAGNVQIKWPNDVFANGQKIAGVLCEASVGGSSPECEVLVGMGVNVCNSSPTTSVLDVQAMTESELQTAREQFAGLLLTSFEELYDEFCTFGFEQRLMDVYLKLWMHDGQKVRIGDKNGPVAIVKGLAPNGWVRVFRQDWAAFQDLPPEETSLDMEHGIVKEKRPC